MFSIIKIKYRKKLPCGLILMTHGKQVLSYTMKAFRLFIYFCVTLILMTGNVTSQDKQKVYVIPVSGAVDPGMAAFFERTLTEYAKDPQALVVIEMDTFGGRVDSALEIVDHLTTIPQSKVVSYVTKRAISAGALIALAANELTMKHNTLIGDCAPIMMSSEGPKMLGEKAQSPLRAKFRALAKRNGYPSILAESMVSLDMEVYQVEFPDKKIYMDAVEFADLNETEKASIISRKTIVAKGELLTMDNTEAKQLGFSQISTSTLEEMLAARGYNDYEIVRIQESWSETFVRYISSIAQILMLIGLGALYLEYKSPGFGIFGIIGLICLGLVFFNQYFVGLANYTELLILIIGILLLAVEVFVLPGFGIAGFAGLTTIGIALLLMLQDFVIPDPALPWQSDLLLKNLVQVLVSFIAAFILTMVMFRYFLPRVSKVVNGPFLEGTLKESHITQATEKGVQVGDVGRADTFLRPSGKIVVGNKLFDAITSGDFIEKGTAVRIIKIDGNRIVVINES
ncbi:MAG: ATP-dependent Clp protease proteolytic subunit [Proteobacteria bacterium]|nr:ATP-dependent Clp protease proteolytic subunit [Pseudomonadota bacterium]